MFKITVESDGRTEASRNRDYAVAIREAATFVGFGMLNGNKAKTFSFSGLPEMENADELEAPAPTS